MHNSKKTSKIVWTPPFRMNVSLWLKKIYQWYEEKNQVTDFMGRRNIGELMAEKGHIWCLGMDDGS